MMVVIESRRKTGGAHGRFAGHASCWGFWMLRKFVVGPSLKLAVTRIWSGNEHRICAGRPNIRADCCLNNTDHCREDVSPPADR
jgi:hypothetical protein